MKKRKFDAITESNICEEYIKGMSTIKLAEKYNCKWSETILSVLKRHNVPRRDRSNQRRVYTINENYFDEVDTQEKSYFLGLLYADGGYVRDSISISLQEKDAYLLQKMNDNIGSNKPLRYYTNNWDCRYAKLSISNKHLVSKLHDLGITPRKSFKIRFPKLKSHLIKDFIRGFFDGDGCLCIQKKSNKGLVTITSNESFCNDMKKIICEEIKINCQVYKIKNKTSNRVTISGNQQILKFCDWIYCDSIVHMDRKFQKYIDLKKKPVSCTKQQQES
jgi:predicted nucleic acid-binding protein